MMTEAVRRSIWSIIRVEWEYINKYEKYNKIEKSEENVAEN